MRPLLRLRLRQFIRPLHSPAAHQRRAPERNVFVLGASLAAAGYVSWRIAGSDQHIALDATPKQPPQKASLPGPRPEETEMDPSAPLVPDRSKTPGPRQIDAPVGKEIERRSNSEMGAKYPPDSQLESVVQTDGTSDSEGNIDEGEGEGQGAFNPVTGEINWDCPCLGGMAHGPCGQQFREAFSCFVFSEQEPKGIDCVEKFKNMQDCFREHPDVYGEEIADDEDGAASDPSPAGQITTKESSDSPAVRPTSPDSSRGPVSVSDKAMSREKQ